MMPAPAEFLLDPIKDMAAQTVSLRLHVSECGGNEHWAGAPGAGVSGFACVRGSGFRWHSIPCVFEPKIEVSIEGYRKGKIGVPSIDLPCFVAGFGNDKAFSHH